MILRLGNSLRYFGYLFTLRIMLRTCSFMGDNVSNCNPQRLWFSRVFRSRTRKVVIMIPVRLAFLNFATLLTAITFAQVQTSSRELGLEKAGAFAVSKIKGTTNSALATSPWPMFRNNVLGTGLSPWGGCNGNQLWDVSLGSETFFSSPAIGPDGTVYTGTESGELFAISPTGTIDWSFATKDSIWSSPTVGSNGTIYIGSDDFYVYAINPNGTKLWSFATGDQVVSSPCLGTDGTVYIGSWDGYFYAISGTGSLKWKYKVGSPVLSSPAIASDGTIYVGANDKNLYAFTATGTVKWKFLTKGPIQSSPSIGADGTVYIGSVASAGDFYAVTPTGTEAWVFNTGSSIISSPAIGADGTI